MISFFLKYEELIVQLPVNPEKITIIGGANNSTSQVVSIGDINNLGYTKLKEITIESFLPRGVTGYVQTAGKFEQPEFYINFLERVQRDRQPLRLIVTDTLLNMMMSIEEFEYTLQYGTNDIDFTLTLKEYRTHTVRILSASSISTSTSTTTSTSGNNTVSPTSTNSNRPVEKTKVTSYTVKKGDTLWLIAKKTLGNGSRWREIYNYSNNKKTIGGNPNKIKIGQKLSIPKK